EQQGQRHRTLLDWARQMIKQVRRWWPDRPRVIVVDSTFAPLNFLGATRRYAAVITRLRLEAALYAPAPAGFAGQHVRSRLKAPRLPSLAKVSLDPAKRREKLIISKWYGQPNRSVEVVSATAMWYHSGMPVLPLRWVLFRNPLGQFETQALCCTDLQTTPAFMFECIVCRWQI